MDEAIEVAPVALPSLYSPDPAEMLEQARTQANILANVIQDQRLFVTIQSRRHILVGGWTFLGAMTGVHPITEWTRQCEVDGAHGWEARVIVKHLASGEIIGAAESMCMSNEVVSKKTRATWGDRGEYAMRGMAETRARSRALRGPLEFIVQLAGFETTPAEEMPGEHMARPTDSQNGNVRDILDQLKELDDMDPEKAAARDAWAAVTGAVGRFPSTYEQAELLLGKLGELGFHPSADDPLTDAEAPYT